MMLIGLSGGDRAVREAIAHLLREKREYLVSPSCNTAGVMFFLNLLRMGREWDDLRVLVPFVEGDRLADYVRSQGGFVFHVLERGALPDVVKKPVDFVVRHDSTIDELFRRIDDVSGSIEYARAQAS